MRRLLATAVVLVGSVAMVLSASGQQGLDPARLKQMVARLDANGDGEITADEVPEGGKQPFERLLQAGDANKDGKLDKQELQALTERVEKAKKGQQPNPVERVRAMDKNQDGKVSKEEFAGPADMFDRLDANKDGFVVPDEVRTFFAKKAQFKTDPRFKPKDSTGLVPLNDLKTGMYKGKSGGLYPGGSNERPSSHEEAGLRLASQVVPRDADGKPSPDGKIVLLSVGMSNTTQEFSTFMRLAAAETDKNPQLVLVDGAQGGMTAAIISNPGSPRFDQYWNTVAARLKEAGVTPAQVQVAWIKEADARPESDFPTYAKTLQAELVKVVQILKDKFPNLVLAYNSSRIYGGYAVTALNPEPYAYESGFAVKWLIEQQIDGDPALNFDPAKGTVKAPWLAWGPYLWADGMKARSDGLSYVQSDLVQDGTHPSPEGGRVKVARLLLDFFKSDSTTKPWFLKEAKSEK